MPHCILEFSDNVVDRPDLRAVLAAIHDGLMSTGMFVSGDIKCRAIEHRAYVVGDGAADRTFVTLDIQVLSGKTDDAKAGLAEQALAVLERFYPHTLAESRCSLTVQVTDIHAPSYRRTRTYES